MIYDYKCSKCQEVLSVERSIHEEPKDPSCFVCHITMNRIYDAPGITFKGGGFYSNGG
jgi:putative FmdB family regulatory protein